MTKMVEQKAQYVFDANTDTTFLDGYPDFIVQLVAWILQKVWAHKLAKMSDGEILKEYYRLTQRGESDDYIISKAADGGFEN